MNHWIGRDRDANSLSALRTLDNLATSTDRNRHDLSAYDIGTHNANMVGHDDSLSGITASSSIRTSQSGCGFSDSMARLITNKNNHGHTLSLAEYRLLSMVP